MRRAAAIAVPFLALLAVLSGAFLVDRHQSKRIAALEPAPMALRLAGAGPVLLFGDSRVAQWPLPPGWAKSGYPGHTAPRIAPLIGPALDRNPARAVVVQVGINDLFGICYLPPERRDAAQARSLAAIAAIAATARARGARVVLLTVIPPIGLDPLRAGLTRGCLESRLGLFNEALGRVGNVLVVDASAPLRDGDDWRPGMARDALHFTPAAYARLTAAVDAAIGAPR